MRRAPPLQVVVPASTSNLGPGFDLLGLALSLHLRVELRGTSRSRIERRGTLAPLRVPFRADLLVRAAAALARRAGARLPRLDLLADSEIPVARGLGSSGAAVAAGLLLADALLGTRLARKELAAIGADLEGHPENVAASLLGGLVAGRPRPGGGWLFFRPLHDRRLRAAVAWPSVEIPTEQSRAALPRSVGFDVARDNARNLATLLEGLRRLDPDCLRLGIRDGLHVPRRARRIPAYGAVVEAARRAGALAATISGSGSAVLALCASARAARRAARAMAGAFRDAGAGGEGRALPIAVRGARVLGAVDSVGLTPGTAAGGGPPRPGSCTGPPPSRAGGTRARRARGWPA
ncbi:MAG TPA: homoserine kinase [Planctomycetota bacterium]|nr:homoserine kinase [Planctomycetota bacterium]